MLHRDHAGCLGANQRLRRSIMDENDVCPGVGAMRAMHKTAARHSIFMAADFEVNFRAEDFVARTLAATNDRGADVIMDMIGGEYVARNYAAAAVDGRIVQIAFMQGQRAVVDLRPIMQKRLIHTGSTLRPRGVAEKAVIADALLARVWPLIEAGRCKPVIDSVFPLAEAAKAHARIESGAHVGKIVLTTRLQVET